MRPLYSYEASQRSWVRIFAENRRSISRTISRYAAAAGPIRSDERPKSRWIEIAEENLHEELLFLRTEIYRWADVDPPIQRLTAFDRFRSRN
ncbi:MAG: polymerase subunit epsilon [Bradyrhizobium sp.]|nr:polymerase subunit epsilon [Bradyrhizobium sp.]